MFILCAQVSLVSENISAISHNLVGYLLIMLNNLMMATLSYQTIKDIGLINIARISFLAYTIPVIFPYFEAGEMISEIHITLAFSGLVILVACLLKVLIYYQRYNYALSHRLLSLMALSTVVILLIYSKFLLVNGLMEIVFTVTIMHSLAMIDKDNHAKSIN